MRSRMIIVCRNSEPKKPIKIKIIQARKIYSPKLPVLHKDSEIEGFFEKGKIGTPLGLSISKRT